MPGSGKTTFGLLFLLNSPAACNFIFDWNDRIGPRLSGKTIPGSQYPFRVAYTENEIEAAINTRWVIFNPKRMFEGAMFDRKTATQALRYFAKKAREVSKRGPGKKSFYVPELWMFSTEDSIPPELALLAQDGRQDEVRLIVDTQRPELTNASVTGQCTELVCFRLDEPDALRAVSKLGMPLDKVRNLPLGTFISLNRLNRQTLSGSVFR